MEQMTLVKAARELPREVVDRLVEQVGFEVSGTSLVFVGEASPSRRTAVDKILETVARPSVLRHREFVEFEAQDYDQAAALELAFPELWLDALQDPDACSECGRPFSDPDFSRVYDVRVPSNVVVINGSVLVVADFVSRAADELGLAGAEYSPFTPDWRFRYVRILRDVEAVGPDLTRGVCTSCDRSVVRPALGPLQFREDLVAAVDVFRCSALAATVFRRKWLEILQHAGGEVRPWRPVRLLQG